MYDYNELQDVEFDDFVNYFELSQVEIRSCLTALYLTDTKLSVRKIAREFCISKSQVHRDLHRVRKLSVVLHNRVKTILRNNKLCYFKGVF